MLNSCVNIYEIRLANARALLLSLDGDNKITAMAEKLGKSQSLISRMMGAGDSKRKNIGNAVARDIEKAFDKPDGWLDQKHSEIKQTEIKAGDGANNDQELLLTSVPVVGLITKKGSTVMLKQVNLGVKTTLSKSGTARCYQEDSGIFEPRIRVNEYIVVESDQQISTEDDVVIHFKNGDISIGQYISEDDKYYRFDDINHASPRQRIAKDQVELIEKITNRCS